MTKLKGLMTIFSAVVSFAQDFLWTIGILTTFAFFAVQAIGLDKAAKILLIILIAIIAMLLGFYLGKYAELSLPSQFNYNVIESIHLYKIHTDDHFKTHENTITKTIQARRDNISFLECGYRWPTKKAFKVICDDSTNQIIDLSNISKTNWNTFLIHFLPLMRKEKRTISYTIKVHDSDYEMNNYFLINISEPVAKATVKVSIPDELIIKKSIQCVSLADRGRLDIIKKYAYYEKDGFKYYTFSHPKSKYKYGFIWKWKPECCYNPD